MLKAILIYLLFLLTIIGCRKEFVNEPFENEKDTPAWLKEKINEMSVNQLYFGTKVYRYQWNKNYLYHITSPINSCLYCKLYNKDGILVQLDDDSFTDFLENKTGEILIWEWNNSEFN